MVGAAIMLTLVGAIFGSQRAGSSFTPPNNAGSSSGGTGLPSNVESQGNAVSSGVPESLSEAREAFDQAVADNYGDSNLEVDEVMEFANNYYAEVRESDTGIYAMELLIDKGSGRVYPEPGPNMMWNTKYGMMSGRGMGGMMGPGNGMMGPNGDGMMGPGGRGGMGGMMGPGNATNGVPSQASPDDPMTITPEQATEIAEDYLSLLSPGTETEEPDQFYGYYTLHTEQEGEVTGMLSINGHTGQMWYHGWHGPFIAMEESHSGEDG